jgi:hypothetical protein
MRPGRTSSFAVVVESLSLVRRCYPEVKIKLGTVVSSLNADSVQRIPVALAPFIDPPDVWKLYQTSYSNYGKDNKDLLNLAGDAFEAAVKKARVAAAKQGWLTTIYRNSERDGKYLFIEPSGEAMVIANSEEIVIGNFLEDFEAVVRAWRRHVDIERLVKNVDDTYFGSRP